MAFLNKIIDANDMAWYDTPNVSITSNEGTNGTTLSANYGQRRNYNKVKDGGIAPCAKMRGDKCKNLHHHLTILVHMNK